MFCGIKCAMYNKQIIIKECVAVSINICPWQDSMQFGILRYTGVQVGCQLCEANLWAGNPFRGLQSDQMNKNIPPTHETAPLFLYKYVIRATHSQSMNEQQLCISCTCVEQQMQGRVRVTTSGRRLRFHYIIIAIQKVRHRTLISLSGRLHSTNTGKWQKTQIISH